MGISWLLRLNDNQTRFAVAHLTRSFGWALTDLLLAWHLHTVVGLSGAVTSALMMVLLLIGALANIVVGCSLTARRAAPPSFLRLQLIGAAITAPVLAAQFLLHDPIAVVAVAVLFRLSFAMQDVPQSALGSLLANDDPDAARYAQLRVLLSGCSRIGAVLLHILLLRIGSQGLEVATFALIGLGLVASSSRLFGLRFPTIVAYRAGDRKASSTPPGLLRLLCAFAISTALLPTVNRLMIFTPIRSAPIADTGNWLLVAFYCGVVVGPLLQSRLEADRRGNQVWLVAITLAAGSAITLVFAHLLIAMIVAAAVHGTALSMIGARLWADAARVAMSDARHGPRRDGLVAGAVTLTTHLSMAMGSGLLAPLIEGYETADPQAAMAAALLVCVGTLAIAPLAIRRRTRPAMA